MAHNLGRSVASITDKAKRNRTIAKGPGKGGLVADVPEDACAHLLAYPRTCNGCRLCRYHCSERLKCEHSAAQALTDGLLSKARERQGVRLRASHGLQQVGRGPELLDRQDSAGPDTKLRRSRLQAQEGAHPAKSTSHGLERSCKASRRYQVYRACSVYTIISYLKNHGVRGIED